MSERSRTALIRQLSTEQEKSAFVGKALNAAGTGALRVGEKFLDVTGQLAKHPSQFATTIKGHKVDLPEVVRHVGVAGGLGMAGLGLAKTTAHDFPGQVRKFQDELAPSTIQNFRRTNF